MSHWYALDRLGVSLVSRYIHCHDSLVLFNLKQFSILFCILYDSDILKSLASYFREQSLDFGMSDFPSWIDSDYAFLVGIS
jgi:hypothetical protein